MRGAEIEASGFEGLLDPHRVMSAQGGDQLADALARCYGARMLPSLRSDAHVQGIGNRIHLKGGALHYCRYSRQVVIDFPPNTAFRQFFCLTGRGEIRMGKRVVGIDPLTSCLVPPGGEIRATYGDGFSQLIVQIDPRALLLKAEQLEGRDFDGMVGLPDMEPLAVAKIRDLRTVALMLALKFSNASAPNELLVSDLFQTLLSLFLIDNARAFPELLRLHPIIQNRDKIKLFEDYINVNWNKDITVEDIAERCGFSVRTVFSQFKRAHATSPTAYLRGVRLEQARRMILADEAGASVTQIAMACQFASFGHFARRYREKFGELPSETMAKRLKASNG